MTDRIRAMKDFQWERKHHAARIQLDRNMKLPYRDANLPDYTRTALRLKLALDMESPFLFPNELIAFTRTVPALPLIFDEKEWADIKAAHFIHEMGNISNLSPDYGTIIQSGLLVLKEQLTGSEYHKAIAASIDAVLSLTARYEAAARENGNVALADVLKKVPAHGASSFRAGAPGLRAESRLCR